MNRLRWIAASAIALAASPIAAAPASQFSPQRLSEIDKTLSSDAFQGRGTGAAIEPTVIDYIAKQLAAAGVQPGGDLVNGRRTWFQAVPLLQSEIVGTPNISLNENGTAVPLRDGPDIAVIAPLNGQKSVSIANAPLLFVGYGVTAPERSWDDFKGVDVHGKILVELINDPDFEGGEGDFGGKAMTYYGRWTYKYEEAARRGAAGVIIVHETAPASYPWNVVQNSNTNAQFDIVRDNPAAKHTQFEILDPAAACGPAVPARGSRLRTGKAAAKRRDFHPIPLKATLSASYAADTKVITSHNVVGNPSRQPPSRRDDHLQRALGPSRCRQARRDRRPHLQRRRGQRDRRRPADRAGARLR